MMKYPINKPPKDVTPRNIMIARNITIDDSSSPLLNNTVVDWILSTSFDYHQPKISFLKRIRNFLRWSISIDFPIKKYQYSFHREKSGRLRRRKAYQFGFLKIFGPFLD